MERNEIAVIEASLLGNEKAFEELVSPYLQPVYSFVLSLTHDAVMAEDVTQETCIKVWRHLDRFDTRRRFKTWVFAIAKNTAFDALKKKRDFPFSAFLQEEDEEVEGAWSERIADDSPLPDELLARADAAKFLEQRLERLPAGFQQILRLRYQEDFSLSEISEILGEPYNTIKSRHGRALLSLRQAFGADVSSASELLGKS